MICEPRWVTSVTGRDGYVPDLFRDALVEKSSFVGVTTRHASLGIWPRAARPCYWQTPGGI